MVDADSLSEMLTELGPILEPAAILAATDTASWTVAMSEDIGVEMRLDAETDLLVFEARVGPVSEAGDGIIPRLLAFNADPVQHGGIWMSLDAPGGTVMQSKVCHGEQFDRYRLQNEIQSFIDQLRAWRELIPPPPDDGDAEVPEEPLGADERPGDDAVRV